ncbi:DUF4440 domain-containing protein [Saccharopolyspora dendranthemae]|uniref:DUF4440 domain-containing protein n=1 Tax=Saccharopolyspora dendranthemae TaxID=1181886 RepID=A0A561VA07_9PSEU|nr:nuclear transport factor 2 family protein [Saccharopolyspora dendranthemae]TWG08442.1 hypothetical protein FHU35_111061 [Saccharopolyspora dendranthemae]
MDDETEAVIAAELRLLEPETRRNGDAVRELLHPDFREFGQSGRTWDRDSVVDAISDSTEPIRAEGIRSTRLGPDTILLTYTAHRSGSASLRTSIWVRSDQTWLMLHSHGTTTAPSHD